MSGSGYSTAPSGGKDTEDFRQRADRGRAAEGYTMLVFSAFVLGVGIWRLSASEVPLGTMFVLGSVSAALYGGGRIAMGRQILRSAGYWQLGAGFLQFGPSRRIGIRDYLPATVALLGALIAILMQLSSGLSSSSGVWTLALSAMLLLGSVLNMASVPAGGRRAPEIILTPDAVWIWTGGRKRACIPWAARPNLEASIVHRLRPHVMITGGTSGPVLFPIVVVPIGHVQLQAVLRFYTIHAELRGELSSGRGLQRVQGLMASPEHVGEESTSSRLPGAPAQNGEHAASPADLVQEPSRPSVPSPSPVSPYGGTPYDSTPYGGSPYVTPERGPAGLQPMTPTTASFESAAGGPSVPAAPAGHGYGARPSSPETLSRHDAEDGPQQDADSSSPEPESCEEADRRARRVPGRYLIWAIIVLVGSAYITTSRQTGVFFLGFVVSLVLLIHAAALAGARRSRAVANRRWTWSSEGICLRNTWFVPLAVHLEAVLMGMGGLLSVGLLALSDRADRGGVVLPFVVAMVLLITAAFLGLATPLPRRRAEIVLSPERIRFAAGTRRESPFWWADRPRIVGVSRGDTVLVDVEPMGRVRARLDTRPLTYTQLQRVVTFYSHHPELRGELATQQGLLRVQGLTGPASVAPQL